MGFGRAHEEVFPMSVMEQAEIQSLLPHRYPFLLVDRVQELDPDRRIVGVKNVTINEPFFQGHFPGRPVMPGVLILEAMAQVGAVLAFKSMGHMTRPAVYLTGIDGAKFRKPVVPGDRLRFEIDVVKKRGPFWKMQGKAFVEAEVVCEAEVTAMEWVRAAEAEAERVSASHIQAANRASLEAPILPSTPPAEEYVYEPVADEDDEQPQEVSGDEGALASATKRRAVRRR
jgi:beta-hydroxyacyl-ACP dehydratase FabZ